VKRGRPDWLVIARRELLERVRTPWFLVVTLLGPLAMVALIVLPAVLASRDTDVRMRIVDRTGVLAAPLVTELGQFGWKVSAAPADASEASLLAQIKADEIDGFLTIPDTVLRKPGLVRYQGDNATNQKIALILDRTVRTEVERARGRSAGLREDQLNLLLTPVGVEPRHTTGEGEGSSGGATFLLGYAIMLIIYFAIVLYAVNVMRSVVQEKTSRVVEIMVAAAKPRALMLGKVLGVGTAGLIQMIAWLGMAFLTMRYRMELLGLFGATGGFTLPELSLPEAVVILGYFLLGYFFYAALFAALGAMVSSDQEAQQVQTPVTMLLMIPVLCVNVVTGDPRGAAAEVLTMIPFTSPMLMPMRYLLGGAGLGQLLASTALLMAGIVAVSLAAARIYRVGILSYGKRPSLRELARWLRHG
jgi:ABC-2 type transport system permease protein